MAKTGYSIRIMSSNSGVMEEFLGKSAHNSIMVSVKNNRPEVK